MRFEAVTRAIRLGCLAVGVAACGGTATDEGTGSARLVLDLRALMAGAFQVVDPVSVLDTARLTVASGGEETTSTLPLGQGDTTATFDISVESGDVRFMLDILSNNQTLLYQADVTSTVDQDDFAVSITPEAVNPVMVIWPRNPPFAQIVFSDQTAFVARWLFRNAGPDSLLWTIDTTASDGVLACRIFPSDTDCLEPTATVRSAEPDTVQVIFREIGPGITRMLTFTSNVGRASFATGIP